jgi:hypothetical protein
MLHHSRNQYRHLSLSIPSLYYSRELRSQIFPLSLLRGRPRKREKGKHEKRKKHAKTEADFL